MLADESDEPLDITLKLLRGVVAFDVEEKALAAGCDDFDTKPIELDRLLAKIEALLTRGAGA